jgi:Fe-S cluster biogenesis protein NfuA
MTERTDEEVIKNIKELIETHVKPAVASHGGNIEFLSFENGHLLLELGGACSGCAGSTMTLKMGVENMMRHLVPEVKTIEAFDDPFSNVDPFYTTPFYDDLIDVRHLEGDDQYDPDN